MTVRGGMGALQHRWKGAILWPREFQGLDPPSIVDAVPMVIFVGGELTPALRNSSRRIAIGSRQ